MTASPEFFLFQAAEHMFGSVDKKQVAAGDMGGGNRIDYKLGMTASQHDDTKKTKILTV